MKIAQLERDLKDILEKCISVKVIFDCMEKTEDSIWILKDGKMNNKFTNEFDNNLRSYLLNQIELPVPSDLFEYEGEGLITQENGRIVIDYITILSEFWVDDESDMDFGGYWVKTSEVLEKYTGKAILF